MPFSIENGVKTVVPFADGRVLAGIAYDAATNTLNARWDVPVVTNGITTNQPARKSYTKDMKDELSGEVADGAAIAAAFGW